MSSSTLPFGIDVSSWQGTINWNVVAAYRPKVEFVAIRAGTSWGYKDPTFDYNWREARRVGIPRTAYHVFFPGEDPVRQMNHFLNIVGNDHGELPLTEDIELHHNVPPATYRIRLYNALQYLKQRSNRPAIIYSRASFMDHYVTSTSTPPSWYGQHDWWLAQYLLSGVEHPGPPALPKGVTRDRVIMHQTSDRGAPIGVSSNTLDYNRWQFPLSHLLNYVTNSLPPPVPVEDRVRRLQLSIRDFMDLFK